MLVAGLGEKTHKVKWIRDFFFGNYPGIRSLLWFSLIN